MVLQVESVCFRSYSKHTDCSDRSAAIQVDSLSCGELADARVVSLDDEVPTDDEWCSSDKENDAVFPFHPTASVVAMERIFAKQRLPNFVRPKGYISPLRCPSRLRAAPVPSHVSLFFLIL